MLIDGFDNVKSAMERIVILRFAPILQTSTVTSLMFLFFFYIISFFIFLNLCAYLNMDRDHILAN